MRKILIVAPAFPPQVGATPQRIAKFVKYLPDFGWSPTVVTLASGFSHDPSAEMSLLPEVSKAHIIGLKPLFMRPAFRPLRGVLDRVLVPDSHVLWLGLIRKSIEQLLKIEEFDAVMTSSAPFSLTLLGGTFRRHRLPWVTDYSDPWTLNARFHEWAPIPPLRPLHRYFERKAAVQCSYHVANTDGQHAQMLGLYPELAGKSSVIPNGFDPPDFARAEAPVPRGDRPWKLVYAGATYYGYGPEQVFSAVRRFLDQHPEACVEIHYAGMHAPRFLKGADAHNLRSLVHDHGHLDHFEAVRLIQGADLLLLFLPDTAQAATWIPGKLYEYLATGRPIFAALPEGDAASIIRSTQAGDVVIGPDVAELGARILQERYQAFSRGEVLRGSSSATIRTFEHRSLTERLARVLEQVAGSAELGGARAGHEAVSSSSRAILFDLDGTLVDSRADLAVSVNFALKAVGLPERPEAEIFKFIGHGAWRLIELAVAPRMELLEPALSTWRTHYAEHLIDRTRPYPGVEKLLQRLTGVLAIHTGKSGVLARRMLQGLNLAHHFSAIVGAEDVEPAKPDPAGARWILESLGVSATNAVYVGDSMEDVTTARRAGIRFVGVAWGIRIAEVRGAGELIATDANDLERIIG